MSTIKTNNLQHTGSADVNLALDSSGYVAIQDGAAGTPALYFSGDSNTGVYSPGADSVAISTGGTARATVDSSGRLLVGTTTTRSFKVGGSTYVPQTHLEGGVFQAALTRTQAPFLGFAASDTATSGMNIGNISFHGNDASNYLQAATIYAEIDGTPGTNDMPGRIVLATTADGASSPTERMRLTSDGTLLTGGLTVKQITSNAGGVHASLLVAANSGAEALLVGRTTNDGDLVRFYQDNTQEGSISVSGTTVSYNGAHLSRWSQLPSGAERKEILRGTVLSNIDEMCEWGDEDNEQLNRMKVSDVEGDKNVSGVFQAWDDDDDTYVNDFFCAMTGDFIIRIAEGVTVERGDLLMSAGDGTAKPQDDDIIRSKTIAKVTSTNVSCTYDDGSYCVPCVLMAC